jgi:hypothetical protein
MSKSSQAHESAHPPKGAVDRYRKVMVKLRPASGCSESEKAVARKVLRNLEVKYPGVRAWAEMPVVDIPFSDIPEPPPGATFHTSGVANPATSAAESPIRGIFDFARGIFDAVSMKNQVDGLVVQTSRVAVRTKVDGTVRVTVDIDPRALDALRRTSPTSAYDFADSVGSLVTAELLDVIDL